MELRNESGREFKDISSEGYRTYKLCNGETYIIVNPQFLHVSKSGHYILDDDGVMHYLPCISWYTISWKAREGSPHIVI